MFLWVRNIKKILLNFHYRYIVNRLLMLMSDCPQLQPSGSLLKRLPWSLVYPGYQGTLVANTWCIVILITIVNGPFMYDQGKCLHKNIYISGLTNYVAILLGAILYTNKLKTIPSSKINGTMLPLIGVSLFNMAPFMWAILLYIRHNTCA